MTMPAYQNIAQATDLTIKVNGDPLRIDYRQLEAFHNGDSWFGCAVGFRALQMAAKTFADAEPWSQDNLYIVSGHPGPGVKDAIELVTQCISAKRFRLLDESGTTTCSRDMKFEWWLSDDRITVHIKLHDDFVPEAFYQLLDRLSQDRYNTNDEQANDRNSFKQYKIDLSLQLWQQPLDALFNVAILPTALSIGELPHA